MNKWQDGIVTLCLLLAPVTGLVAAPFTVSIVRSDAPGVPVPQGPSFRSWGSDTGSEVVDTLPGLSLDGRGVFSRSLETNEVKLAAVEPTVQVDLSDGEHVLNPGGHRFTVAGTTVTAQSASLAVAGNTLRWALFPVAFSSYSERLRAYAHVWPGLLLNNSRVYNAPDRLPYYVAPERYVIYLPASAGYDSVYAPAPFEVSPTGVVYAATDAAGLAADFHPQGFEIRSPASVVEMHTLSDSPECVCLWLSNHGYHHHDNTTAWVRDMTRPVAFVRGGYEVRVALADGEGHQQGGSKNGLWVSPAPPTAQTIVGGRTVIGGVEARVLRLTVPAGAVPAGDDFPLGVEFLDNPLKPSFRSAEVKTFIAPFATDPSGRREWRVLERTGKNGSLAKGTTLRPGKYLVRAVVDEAGLADWGSALQAEQTLLVAAPEGSARLTLTTGRRRVFVAGEPITVFLQASAAAGANLEAACSLKPVSVPSDPIDLGVQRLACGQTGKAVRALVIPAEATRLLAGGAWEVAVQLRPAGVVQPATLYLARPEEFGRFPIFLYGYGSDPAGGNEGMAFDRLGFNMTLASWLRFPGGDYEQRLEAALMHGARWLPQIYLQDTPEVDLVLPWMVAAQERMMQLYAQGCADWPNLLGFQYSNWAGTRWINKESTNNEEQSRAAYRAFFRQETGLTNTPPEFEDRSLVRTPPFVPGNPALYEPYTQFFIQRWGTIMDSWNRRIATVDPTLITTDMRGLSIAHGEFLSTMDLFTYSSIYTLTVKPLEFVPAFGGSEWQGMPCGDALAVDLNRSLSGRRKTVVPVNWGAWQEPSQADFLKRMMDSFSRGGVPGALSFVYDLNLLGGSARAIYTHQDYGRGSRTELVNDILRRFGPLMQGLEPSRDVAILLSTRNAVYTADPVVYGADLFGAYAACLHNHRPAVYVTEEEVAEGALNDVKVLLAPDVTVPLQPATMTALTAFTKGGGRLLTDSRTTEALPGATRLAMAFNGADERMGVVRNEVAARFNHRVPSDPAERHQWVMAGFRAMGDTRFDVVRALAGEVGPALRTAIDAAVPPPVDTESLDVLLSAMPNGEGRVFFAVNGTPPPFGTNAMQMARPLLFLRQSWIDPVQAPVRLRASGGVLYDLFAGREVSCQQGSPGEQVFQADLRWLEGKIYLWLPRPPARLQLGAAPVGEAMSLAVAVQDRAGRPLRARLPLVITIRANGRPVIKDFADSTDTNGEFRISIPFAPPAQPEKWRVTVQEAASGLTAATEVDVKPRAAGGVTVQADSGSGVFMFRADKVARFRKGAGPVIIPLAAGPETAVAAEAIRRLQAAGYTATAAAYTNLVSGYNMRYRKQPSPPVSAIRGRLVLLAAPGQHRLLDELGGSGLLPFTMGEDFPVLGGALVTCVLSAFNLDDDVLVVAAADGAGMLKGLAAALGTEPPALTVPSGAAALRASLQFPALMTRERRSDGISLPSTADDGIAMPSLQKTPAFAVTSKTRRPLAAIEQKSGPGVYVCSASPDSSSLVVGTDYRGTNLHLIDARRGRVKWSRAVGDWWVHQAQVATAGKVVAAAASLAGETVLLDADGRVLGRARAARDPEGMYSTPEEKDFFALAPDGSTLCVFNEKGGLTVRSPGVTEARWVRAADEVGDVGVDIESTLAAPVGGEAPPVRKAYACELRCLAWGKGLILSGWQDKGGPLLVASEPAKGRTLWQCSFAKAGAGLRKLTRIAGGASGRIAVSDPSGNVCLVSGEGKLVASYSASLRGAPADVDLCWDGEGRRLLITPQEGRYGVPAALLCVDTMTGTCSRVMTDEVPASAALSPDGSRIALSMWTGGFEMRDLNGKVLWNRATDTGGRVCFLPNGQAVVVATRAGLVKAWSLDGKECWSVDLKAAE